VTLSSLPDWSNFQPSRNWSSNEF